MVNTVSLMSAGVCSALILFIRRGRFGDPCVAGFHCDGPRSVSWEAGVGIPATQSGNSPMAPGLGATGFYAWKHPRRCFITDSHKPVWGLGGYSHKTLLTHPRSSELRTNVRLSLQCLGSSLPSPESPRWPKAAREAFAVLTCRARACGVTSGNLSQESQGL